MISVSKRGLLMNNKVSLRDAKREDLEGIIAVAGHSFKEDDINSLKLQLGYYFGGPKGFGEKLPSRLLSQDNYVATLGGKVIGFAGIEQDNYNGGSINSAWLGWIAVHPKYKQKGIGSMLIKEAEIRAVSYGCRKLYVQTASIHPDMVNFLSKNGYRIEAALEGYFDDADLLIASKRLCRK